MDDRGGVRRAQRLHDPHRAHGRSHRRGVGRAVAPDRPGAEMTPPWRVVVADRVAGSGLDLLSKTPDIEVIDVAGKPAELDKALAGAHALIVRSETRVTASLMAHAPHLRVVARAGTGVDTIDVPAASRRGIALFHSAGANTISPA